MKAEGKVPLVLAAAAGSCLGWCTAVLVVGLARASIIPVPGIFGSGNAGKPLEKLFYVTFYVAAAVFAFAMARYPGVLKSAPATGLAIVLFLALAAWSASAVIDGDPWSALPILVLAGLVFVAGTRRPAAGAFAYRDVMAWTSDRLSKRDLVWLFACSVFFAACLFPIDLETVAARNGYDPHAVSYYIGPALFMWHRGLVPGIDFFPQYGIGTGAFFAFYLRPTAAATVANTILVTAGASLCYYAFALPVLRKLYASRVAAFAVVLFCLLLNFHTAVRPLSVFIDPSAWPARYPFLFAFVWLFSLAVESKRQARTLAAAGSVAGLSAFLNTETGLYVIASALAATVLLNRNVKQLVTNLLAVAGAAAITFVLLALVAYGPGILQPGFFAGLLKPFAIYAGGFGAVPIVWQSPFNFLFAVVSPVVGFTTMGWSAAAIVRNDKTFQKRTLIVLFLLGMIGNCLMLKWVNMSIDALWHVNALPIVAVSAWWIRTGLQYVRERSSSERVRYGLIAARAGLLAAAVLFLCFVRDERNPSKYALQAFVVYPSVLIGAFERRPWIRWNKKSPPSRADLELVLRCTGHDDRVTIVSDIDWVYLLAAGRSPRMPWLPSTTMSAFPFLVPDAMRTAGPIFLDDRIIVQKLGQQLGEPLASALKTRMTSAYEPGPKGDLLQLYTEVRPRGEGVPRRC